jgi:hypothetical protein
VNAAEVAGPLEVGAQALVKFLRHLVWVPLELFGAILSSALVTVGCVEYQTRGPS